MKFRKKPVVIDAMQFHGADEYLRIVEWMRQSGSTVADECRFSTPEMSIQTLEGTLSARPGDWIIRGVNGEFYPCKPDIFEKTYVSAETKRRFTIVRTYDPDDDDFGGDEWDVSLVDENGDVVMSGDYYHDKIDDRIGAFFETLDYQGVAYEKSEVKRHEGDGERA